MDESATTRAPAAATRAGHRRTVSAKCPRWLVANCSSQPGPTRVSGAAMTPALLMSRCSGSPRSRNRLANARTLARSARSSSPTSVLSMPASCSAASLGTAGRDDHLRAGTGQRTDRLDPDAGVAAGDDRGAAAEVDARDDLRRRAGAAEARADPRLERRRGRCARREVDVEGHGFPLVDRGGELRDLVARRLQHVVAEQQPQWWVVEAGHHQHGLGHLARVAGQMVGELP